MKNDGKLMHRQRPHLTKWVPFLLIMAVAATACGIDISIDDDSVEVTGTLSESRVNRVLRFSFVRQDDDSLLDDITSIDMRPGLIRMLGTYTNSDGSSVPGSVDLTVSAKDGALEAEITAIDISGLDIDHPRVTQINDVIAKAFSDEASLDNDDVEFVSVDITEDGMEFTARVPRP